MQKYIMCKDVEVIERTGDLDNYEKFRIFRLGRLKRYCQKVSLINLIGLEIQ